MRILVTGGAGFIGSHLTDRFLELGHEVFVLDNLETGRKENVSDGAHFILGDVRGEVLHDVVRKFRPEVICHHAGLPSVGDSLRMPDLYASVNFHGTLNVAMAAEKYRVQRVIYGSAATPLYGFQPEGAVTEEALLSPATPYGVYVAASELLLKTYGKRGLDVVCLRYSNVYGTRQNPYRGGVIAIFMESAIQDQVLFVHGDGWQKRDFIHVEDVVRANVAALDYGEGESIHVCTGVETSIRSLAQMVGEVVGKEPSIVYGSDLKDVYGATNLSNSKAWDVLGWSPQISLPEGLKMVYQNYLT